MALKRGLGLPTLVLYGTGVIVGAGIYSLIGVGAGLAGTMLWLAFAISMLIAIFTGMSYVELSSKFPREAAEYIYTKKAFGSEHLSFVVSWVLVSAAVISAAVVALAFGAYLSYLIGGSPVAFSMALILLLSLLNYAGIKDSVIFNNAASLIEIGGLVLVIAVGFAFAGGNSVHVNFLELPPLGLTGVLYAVGVIFFAFIGFEYVANVSEEVKDSRNVVPKAILISVLVAAALYIALSISVFMLTTPQALASSSAPLTEAVQKALPNAGLLLAVIALFATSSTVLIILIGSSRIFYGMSKNGSLPSMFSLVSKRRGTPHVSIMLVGIAAALVCLLGNLELVAQLADLGLFIVYFFVNVSLIKLRNHGTHPHYRSPRLLGVPVLAVAGALSVAAMAIFFDQKIWAAEAGVMLLGLIVFRLYKSRRRVAAIMKT